MSNPFDQFDGAAPKPRARYDAPENVDAFRAAATELGIDPVDLATVVSYETGGTFDPDQPGPTTKWGQHRGLIQFGGPQRQKYGVLPGQSIPEQLPAVVAYLRDAGVKPGMGIMDVYSAINAGAPGRYNASDTAAGGAPGTVADKVNHQMSGHRKRAMAMFGGGSANLFDQFDGTPMADDDNPFDQFGEESVAVPAGDAPDYSAVFEDPGNPLRTSNPVLGLVDRANKIMGSTVRGVANVAEPVGDWLETKIPLSNLTPEQIQQKKQLQPLYDLADWFSKGPIEYTPTTSLDQVKATVDTGTDDSILDRLGTAGSFIGERIVTSVPDMAATLSGYTLPAYILGRTEEVAERRVANDGRTGEPGLGDLAPALPAAAGEALLERFATKVMPGLGSVPGKTAATRIAAQAGIQSGTEALEGGIANVGESLGTERGIVWDELGDAMLEGGIVGGGLGGGVQTVAEGVNAVRGRGAIDPGKVQWDEPAAPQQENAQPQVSEPAEPVSASTPEAAPLAATAAPTEPAVPQAASEAAPVEAAPEPLPAPIEVATPKVAEATEEAPVERQRFASPDDMARGDFVQRAVQRGVPEDVATELAPRATVDEVTGYYDGRAQGVKANTVERAQEHVLNTGESAFYVDGDIVNLGGLNKAAKDDMTVANRHFRAMTDILRSELEAVGADVVPMRTGGDELGAVVINTGETEIRAAMQQADAKIRAYAAQNGLDTIPHTKQGRADVGVGLHLGLSPIVPGVTPSEIFTRASAEVNQSKEGVNVSRSTVAGAGSVAPEGQSAGAERGTGENPAGLRPQDRSAEGAEGAPQAAPASTKQPRAAQGIAAEVLHDRSDFPDEQEDAEVDGEDSAPREAAELEDRSEGAERNTRRKGASDEFTRASFTNRRSWQQAAFRDAGLDPDAAELLPVDKQFEAAAKALKSKFGLTAQKTPKALGRMAVDNALDLYRNAQTMAHVLGLPEKAVGLGDSLTLLFRGDAPYLGAMYPGGGTVEGVKIPAGAIALPGRSNSFSHEWGHALDLHLVAKYGMDPLEGLTTRQIRSEGIDFQPNTSREAFAKLMNAMFFDEAALAARVAALQQAANNGTDAQQAAAKQALGRIAKGNSKLKIDGTKYLIESKSFGASVGGKAGAKYFGDPAEMLARAFEAYVAHRVEAVGGSTEVLAKGDNAYLSNADDRFAKTFPKLDERLKIFAAFDDLFGQLSKEQLIAQGVAASNPGNMDAADPRKWMVKPEPEQLRMYDAFKRDMQDWRRQRTERAERPRDPQPKMQAVQNAVGHLVANIQTMMHMVEARYESDAVRELNDLLVRRPGQGKHVGRVFDEHVAIWLGQQLNMLSNIQSSFKLDRLSKAEKSQLNALLTGGEATDAPEHMMRGAANLRRLMDKWWYDNYEADIILGHAGSGYLPRILDNVLVNSDPDAFLEAATKVERLRLEREGVVDAANLDVAAEGAARAWLFNIQNPQAPDFMRSSGKENYTKNRTLPPEADQILADFYVNDPIEKIVTYAQRAARNIAFAKQFGADGKKLRELFEQMGREGVSANDQKLLRANAETLLGRGGGTWLDHRPELARGLNWFHAAGTMALLGRVVISSAAEPGLVGINTESTASVYKPYLNMMKLALGSADMKAWREITEMIGLTGSHQADMLIQARLGNTFDSTPQVDKKLASYMKLVGLHGYTNLSRTGIMPSQHAYLSRLSETILTGKDAADIGKSHAILSELGIEDTGAFARWISKVGQRPALEDLFDASGQPTKMGDTYITAMTRFNKINIQDPTMAEKSALASTPVGRFMFALTGFNSSFFANFYKRQAALRRGEFDRAQTKAGKAVVVGNVAVGAKVGAAIGAVTGGPVGAVIGGSIGGVVGVKGLAGPVTAYFFTQLLVTAAREAVMNSQRWEEWERDEKLVENLIQLTLSRSFPLGLGDQAVQAYQGLKYQRDLTSVLSGAGLSYFLGNLAKVLAATNPATNSDKTNNAEFGAMQGAYSIVANPLIPALITSLPQSRMLAPLYGAAIMGGTSATARDAVATAAVGEKDSLVAKRKRDERKAAGTGVESAGDRGSSRGSVRNADQRGSTR